MFIIKCTYTLVFVILFSNVFSQHRSYNDKYEYRKKRHEVTLGVGASNCLTDLGGSFISDPNTEVSQIDFLRKLNFQSEFSDFVKTEQRKSAESAFKLENDSFSSGDAEFLFNGKVYKGVYWAGGRSLPFKRKSTNALAFIKSIDVAINNV